MTKLEILMSEIEQRISIIDNDIENEYTSLQKETIKRELLLIYIRCQQLILNNIGK